MDTSQAAGYTDIRYEVSNHVATLTFARPEVLNAMTIGLIAQTIDALDEAAQDADVRVIIVTGEGRAFCAGGDVRRLGDQATHGEELLPPTPFERRAWLRRTQRMIVAFRQVEKPVIAALDYASTAEAITLSSQDHIEGINALREKRPPEFKGR